MSFIRDFCRSHPVLSFVAEIDAVACRSSCPPSPDDELQFDMYSNYRNAWRWSLRRRASFRRPCLSVSFLSFINSLPIRLLFSSFLLPLSLSLSLSLSRSLYLSTLCHFISVSRRFAPFYRCRRIITQKSEFHFVLIERSAQRCAARERRVATFPSLDAQVSHDSSRVSGYSERNVSEQFQTTRRRGDEGVGNGRVALSP